MTDRFYDKSLLPPKLSDGETWTIANNSELIAKTLLRFDKRDISHTLEVNCFAPH